jgi:hypothetical protein
MVNLRSRLPGIYDGPAVALVWKGTLKVYPGFPHGMCTTHPEVINRDLFDSSSNVLTRFIATARRCPGRT